jgi:CTP-dependent riboflavin kinase
MEINQYKEEIRETLSYNDYEGRLIIKQKEDVKEA